MPNARLTFNSNNWMSPSGPYGKSQNLPAYESHHGFGWEEWLMCERHLIDGYQYGHIDGFRYANRDNYAFVPGSGWMVQNLRLYTFERIGAGQLVRYWVGEISELFILEENSIMEFWENTINPNQAQYQNELNAVDANGHQGPGLEGFNQILANGGLDPDTGRGIFNVKFKRSNINLYSRDNWILANEISYYRFRIWG